MSKLDIETKLIQRISPTLQQSIHILQISTSDLQEQLEKELENNPFLEENTEKYHIHRSHTTHHTTTEDTDFSFIPNHVTLKDHIKEQITIMIQKGDQPIALYLLDILEDTGYINLDIDEAAHYLQCHLHDIEKVLAILQECTPSGVFARCLAESLRIQLINQKIYDDIFAIILANMELIAKRQYKQLTKICNIQEPALHERISLIKTLNPKPGLIFSSSTAHYITPDIIVNIDNHGNPVAELSGYIPQLYVNTKYYEVSKTEATTQEARTFVKNAFTAASNMVYMVKQRFQTLLKVARAIIEEQRDFFLKGVLYIKPLTLQQIANRIGMAESTVSRAINNKYIRTSFGIHEFKFFFSSSITTKNVHGKVSSTKVKELIKQIISMEEGSMSDQNIAQELTKFNIKISRRTIAKYRISLKICHSLSRKR